MSQLFKKHARYLACWFWAWFKSSIFVVEKILGFSPKQKTESFLLVFPREDLNPHKQFQRLPCYHYTTGDWVKPAYHGRNKVVKGTCCNQKEGKYIYPTSPISQSIVIISAYLSQIHQKLYNYPQYKEDI